MDAPQCPICIEQYDQRVLVPKQLMCGHSVCAVCATQLWADRVYLWIFGNMLICPSCRTSSVYQKELPTNYALLAVSKEANDPEVVERALAAQQQTLSTKKTVQNLFIYPQALPLPTELKISAILIAKWLALIVAVHCALLAVWNLIYGLAYVVYVTIYSVLYVAYMAVYSIVYYGAYCGFYGLVENLVSWSVFFFYTYALATVALVVLQVGLWRLGRFLITTNQVNQANQLNALQ